MSKRVGLRHVKALTAMLGAPSPPPDEEFEEFSFIEYWNFGPPSVFPLQHSEDWNYPEPPTFTLQYSEAWSS